MRDPSAVGIPSLMVGRANAQAITFPRCHACGLPTWSN
ncbi:hypothetical protein CEV33_3388 [Brucella grignonensis]|uniref:Uncharacterized protein n=1 Tax=Brucella grignonensis TaxID=94627 RepID=A0A256EZA1_9HYPH|nr:hypothetical protein CEV33_3388 [Brucella grignonensis]